VRDLTQCSIARALALLGEKWTLLVLREAFFGVRRFDDMADGLGAPRQVLADRLATLTGAGLLERVPYREPGQRARTEYRLTRMGLDLYPVLVALLEWGDRYLAGPDGPSMELRHRDCGEPVAAVLQCAAGHWVGSARDVRPSPARDIPLTRV
jgi:DNA-binding HxlR family transcriptional regulator